MPTYIDHHEMSDVAPEMAAAIGERIKAGEADDHGVKGLNVFLGKDGTAFWCDARTHRTDPGAAFAYLHRPGAGRISELLAHGS